MNEILTLVDDHDTGMSKVKSDQKLTHHKDPPFYDDFLSNEFRWVDGDYYYVGNEINEANEFLSKYNQGLIIPKIPKIYISYLDKKLKKKVWIQYYILCHPTILHSLPPIFGKYNAKKGENEIKFKKDISLSILRKEIGTLQKEIEKSFLTLFSTDEFYLHLLGNDHKTETTVQKSPKEIVKIQKSPRIPKKEWVDRAVDIGIQRYRAEKMNIKELQDQWNKHVEQKSLKERTNKRDAIFNKEVLKHGYNEVMYRFQVLEIILPFGYDAYYRVYIYYATNILEIQSLIELFQSDGGIVNTWNSTLDEWENDDPHFHSKYDIEEIVLICGKINVEDRNGRTDIEWYEAIFHNDWPKWIKWKILDPKAVIEE